MHEKRCVILILSLFYQLFDLVCELFDNKFRKPRFS